MVFLSNIKFYLIWGSFIYAIFLCIFAIIAYKMYYWNIIEYLCNLNLEFARDIVNNINSVKWPLNANHIQPFNKVLVDQLYHVNDISHYKDYIYPINDSIHCLRNEILSFPNISSRVATLILQDMVAEHTSCVLELTTSPPCLSRGGGVVHKTFLLSLPLFSALTIACLIKVIEVTLAGTITAI